MKPFEIDADVMSRLASELLSQSQPVEPDRPALPGGPLQDFSSALNAALDNLGSRHSVLRADLAQLADVAQATTHAALTADDDAAREFDSWGMGGAR